MKVKEWLNTCNRTSIYLEVWDTDDTIDIPHFVGYSSELQNSPKYRRVLNANLDFWDFDYESANEPVNYYFKLIVSGLKNESKSRKSNGKLGIRESIETTLTGIKVEDIYGDVYVVYCDGSRNGQTLKDFTDDYIFDYMDNWNYDVDENIPAEEFCGDLCAKMYQQFRIPCYMEYINNDFMSDDGTLTLKDGNAVRLIAEYDNFTYDA